MKIKNTLIITSYVLLVALFFATGYALGRKNTEPVPETVIAEDSVKTGGDSIIEAPDYEVIYEGGKIKINKCIGDIKETITDEEIREGVFPPDDIAELKRGVRFERLEAAQQMFENFVS